MTTKHAQALSNEIATARSFMKTAEHDRAMYHLERAHVLGQRFVWPHVLVHWLMFRVAINRLAPGDAAGQLIRIALGAIGSAVGRLPVGNTGGSNVNMFRPMPIDPELAGIMHDGTGIGGFGRQVGGAGPRGI